MGEIIGYIGLGVVVISTAVAFIKRAFVDYYRKVIN